MKQDSTINQLNPETLQSIGRLREALRDVLDKIAELDGVLNTIAANQTAQPETAFAHSPDFRSVLTGGKQYSFTTAQAACIQILYEQWKKNTPGISGQYILLTIGYDSQRLSDLFKKHPAWGQLIISGNTRGTYRLNIS